MEIRFLGTGSAWGVPEHSCECFICKRMTELGEERTRTSFLVIGEESILVDCGPDVRRQMLRLAVQRPDAVLITHEHADHFLGLDDLLAFRRATPRDAWTLIPVYATEMTWASVEARFGYLVGSLIDKRLAVPERPLEGLRTKVRPFKTLHGPTAPGSVGYVIEGKGDPGIVYTSDFIGLDREPEFLFNPDILIIQSHWLNEPERNRPHHMSFQCAIEYIARWRPRRATYLVHVSAGDHVEGDSANNSLGKWRPKAPLPEPATGRPYPVPLCQADWQRLVDGIAEDYGLPRPIFVARDGMVARF